MSTLIKNGQLLTKEGNFEKTDIYIESGKIAGIGEGYETKAQEVIDADGLLIAPGFIDLHVHLRSLAVKRKRLLKLVQRQQQKAVSQRLRRCRIPGLYLIRKNSLKN